MDREGFNVPMRLCTSCGVKRPVLQLEAVLVDGHRVERCRRLDHCNALLRTTPTAAISPATARKAS